MDVDKGKLNLCVVGQKNEKNEAKLWNLPIKKLGWVPHCNVRSPKSELRIAKIPEKWYGEIVENIFKTEQSK